MGLQRLAGGNNVSRNLLHEFSIFVQYTNSVHTVWFDCDGAASTLMFCSLCTKEKKYIIFQGHIFKSISRVCAVLFSYIEWYIIARLANNIKYVLHFYFYVFNIWVRYVSITACLEYFWSYLWPWHFMHSTTIWWLLSSVSFIFI